MRRISYLLAAMLLATVPVFAQETTAKIHGHIQDPVGVAVADAIIILSDDPSMANPRYTFTSDANGDYKGAGIKPGTYAVSLRKGDMPKDKVLDQFIEVRFAAGADVAQDFDMTRASYLSKLSSDQRKQIEATRKANADVLKANAGIKELNANLAKAREDNARGKLGPCIDNSGKAVAGHADPAKCTADGFKPNVPADDFTDAETLMTQSTTVMPTSSILWLELGTAQAGLKKYSDAVTSLKKTIDLDVASKKPNPELQGDADNTLGEVYAAQSMMPEATAAYDDAVKANPSKAGLYYSNQAVILTRLNQPDAAAVAADKAIAADPTLPKPYYLKAQALVGKSTLDPKTNKIVPPPGCIEAYEKYLQLAPDGPYAPEVRDVLAEVSATVKSTYKAKK